VVDRKQGGAELLKSYDIKSFSMVDIDIGLLKGFWIWAYRQGTV